jgi:hypothetical protein
MILRMIHFKISVEHLETGFLIYAMGSNTVNCFTTNQNTVDVLRLLAPGKSCSECKKQPVS